ncbi:protein nervous wreck isoform X2 [Culicoides brevitarsis]|uniref:protein nervous wreck isoform X2 n=1 Tax=Culicoides brevitarsis TaxID=469753 RepID=UPI00307C4A4C
MERMQPPPRKGNYTKFLKGLHAEQLSKLQQKNQHECELLEDIRQFTLKRSAIEKQYSEALLKVSSQYLNKKNVPNIPEIGGSGDERWNMWSVWQTVLEENEKLARARLAAVEVFQQQIADEAKYLRGFKINQSKKSLDLLKNIQSELQLSVSEVDATKKQYFDEEHSAHDVRDKARDIEEKLKKKKGSFFQSIASLQKNSSRVTARKEQLEEKSTGARNDYILSLASANAHQNRYFTVDLQTTMTTMENYVYERIADYLALIGRTELMTCAATQNSFGKIRDQAQQLTREYNIQCCYLYYPSLKQHIQYEFEPCDNDPVRKITAEHDSAADTLNREGKRWAGKVAQSNNTVRDFSRKLAHCMALRDAGHKCDPNDINGPDLETKIDEFREQIRKAEVTKAKCEARLQCLRDGGINVEDWIQEAETTSVQEMPRRESSMSVKSGESRDNDHQSSDSFYDSDAEGQEDQKSVKNQFATVSKPVTTTTQQHSEEFVDSSDEEVPQPKMAPPAAPAAQEQFAVWDDPTQMDWGAASSEPPKTSPPAAPTGVSSSESMQTFKCTALYSYNAQNPDELTIVENEQLEVVGEGDGDGWLRARNYRGEEGFVPHNYLDVERDTSSQDQSAQQLNQQFSFSSVDYTVDNEQEFQQGTSSAQSPDQVSVIAAPTQASSQPKPRPAASDVMYCCACYDYEASAEDELTFEEGQVIRLITKEPHGVDDGWWEGELNGKIGNFPSLVVEECDENGEPFSDEGDEDFEDDEEETLPPTGAPPVIPGMTLADVIITSPPGGDAPTFNLNFNKVKHNNKMDMDLDLTSSAQKKVPAVSIVCEDAEEQSQDPEESGKASSNGALGCVQISVTAATPMVEDADKEFLPQDEEEARDSPPEPEPEVKQQPPPPQQQQQPQAVTEVYNDTILEESEPDEDDEPMKSPPKMAPPPLPPSAVAEEKSEPQAADPNAFEANFEAAFEANFDNAFGNDSEVPKQVVGGRASIPDELEPQQLARLQNLKESNA